MIEKFNGIIYLIIFIVHFIGYAFYAYRCVFGTKAFLDQYGVDHTAVKINKLGHTEKTSDEGIYAPGILMILSAVLCYGLADKIYS